MAQSCRTAMKHMCTASLPTIEYENVKTAYTFRDHMVLSKLDTCTALTALEGSLYLAHAFWPTMSFIYCILQ